MAEAERHAAPPPRRASGARRASPGPHARAATSRPSSRPPRGPQDSSENGLLPVTEPPPRHPGELRETGRDRGADGGPRRRLGRRGAGRRGRGAGLRGGGRRVSSERGVVDDPPPGGALDEVQEREPFGRGPVRVREIFHRATTAIPWGAFFAAGGEDVHREHLERERPARRGVGVPRLVAGEDLRPPLRQPERRQEEGVVGVDRAEPLEVPPVPRRRLRLEERARLRRRRRPAPARASREPAPRPRGRRGARRRGGRRTVPPCAHGIPRPWGNLARGRSRTVTHAPLPLALARRREPPPREDRPLLGLRPQRLGRLRLRRPADLPAFAVGVGGRTCALPLRTVRLGLVRLDHPLRLQGAAAARQGLRARLLPALPDTGPLRPPASGDRLVPRRAPRLVPLPPPRGPAPGGGGARAARPGEGRGAAPLPPPLARRLLPRRGLHRVDLPPPRPPRLPRRAPRTASGRAPSSAFLAGLSRAPAAALGPALGLAWLLAHRDDRRRILRSAALASCPSPASTPGASASASARESRASSSGRWARGASRPATRSRPSWPSSSSRPGLWHRGWSATTPSTSSLRPRAPPRRPRRLAGLGAAASPTPPGPSALGMAMLTGTADGVPRYSLTVYPLFFALVEIGDGTPASAALARPLRRPPPLQLRPLRQLALRFRRRSGGDTRRKRPPLSPSSSTARAPQARDREGRRAGGEGGERGG